MRTIGDFLVAIGRDWIALVSGVVGIIATAMGLWGPATMSGRWLFVAFGFVGLVLAAFSVWRQERRRRRREVKVWRGLSDTARARLKDIEDRAEDIDRQLAPLTERQREAFAKLGRLGEIGGGNQDGWEIGAVVNRVDFVVRERDRFRPTEAYKVPLSLWAKEYKPPAPQEQVLGK